MCPPWSLAVVVSFAVGVFSMPAQAGIISATVTNYSSVPLVDNSFGSVALAMNFGGTTTTIYATTDTANETINQIAAAGRASSAPTNPSSAAPPSAAPNATAGCNSIVRAVMRGAKK